jgi:glutamine synthetase
MEHYGSDNHLRLTGKHETQSIHTFSVGVADRGASIRIPHATQKAMKGYLEDRRPGSNGDPYRILIAMMKSLKEAKAF